MKRSHAAEENLTSKRAKTLRIVSVDEEYMDECLAFSTTSDGTELLLCTHIWEVLPDASVKKLSRMVGTRFEPLLDAVAVINTKEPNVLRLQSLPHNVELARLVLPGLATKYEYMGDGDVRSLSAQHTPQGTFLAAVTNRWLFLVRVSENTLSLEAVVDVAEGELGALTERNCKCCTASFWRGRLEGKCAVLYADASGLHALVSSQGRVIVYTLLSSSTTTGCAPAIKRVIAVHEPRLKSDKHSTICDMTIWKSSLVTVGADGRVAVVSLDTGDVESWYATTRGSAGSRGYAPVHKVAVTDAGIAFTASQREPTAYLWDLNSSKTSPAGKMCGKISRLASGTPSKAHVMRAAASSTLFAYSNSNNGDDATLKIVYA